MNWKRWMSIGMAAALVVGLSNLDMVRAAEDTQTATAFLYFTDGHWAGDVNYHNPGGNEQTKTIAQDAQITGDGTYHLSLDFTQTSGQRTNQCTNAKICIVDGDTIFGENSIITVQKLVIDGVERKPSQEGFTASEERWDNGVLKKDTIFYLFDSNAAGDIGNIKADRVDGAQRTAKDLNSFPDIGIADIGTLEVDFSFAVNPGSNPSKSPGFSESPEPSGSSDPGFTPGPSESPDPGKSPDPNISPDPGKSPNPGGSPDPNTGGSTSAGLVSNSTYSGAEKILIQKDAVIIPAGGSSTLTFALLRSAASGTQVTVSSGNTGIASPLLQSDGKVCINVPRSAAAGGTTTVTLRFGSSTAAIKVTVKNAVTKIKAAKKSYKVKRKKKTTVVFHLTAQNKSKTTTDVPAVKISGKKASVSSVKTAGSKLTVTVKGIKKGSASLKATVGGKSAKTKIKVK